MDDKRGQIIELNVAFITVSIIAVTTRLLTQIFLLKRIRADDVLIIIALFLGLAQASFYIVATRYGQGLHIQYLEPANVPVYYKVILSSSLSGSLCRMFIRLSYLALYLQLAVTKKIFRVILYISIALVSAFGIATSIVCMTLCIPLEKYWTTAIPGHCINGKAFHISVYTLNMVFDIIIFVLPIPLLWALQLPKRQRLTLVGIFALGLIVVIASILRLHNLIVMFNTPAYLSDRTWYSVNKLNWSTVEVHLAILISCTAAFKKLIQRFIPGILGSLSSTKHSSSRNQYNYTTYGGGYLRQPRTHGEPNLKSGIRENVHRGDENGSQEHIMEDLEMSRSDKTGYVRTDSETSINDGCYINHGNVTNQSAGRDRINRDQKVYGEAKSRVAVDEDGSVNDE